MEEGGKTIMPDNKPAAKKPAEKKPVEKNVAEKKPVEKKAPAKKPAEKKPAAKKPAEKKPAAKKPAAKVAEVIIQSPMGGEITPEAILKKVGDVNTVYVRVDQNKAYWVKGEEYGSVDLW